MYEFEKTGQLLPILVGSHMEDPSGGEMEVPILGVEKNKTTGGIQPLGGSMEDPEGAGKILLLFIYMFMKNETTLIT